MEQKQKKDKGLIIGLSIFGGASLVAAGTFCCLWILKKAPTTTTHTINLNPGPGTLEGVTGPIIVLDQTTVGSLPTPKWDGGDFKCWKDTKSGKDLDDPNQNIITDLSLEAVYISHPEPEPEVSNCVCMRNTSTDGETPNIFYVNVDNWDASPKPNLSYSLDNGLTWTEYDYTQIDESNPIEIPYGESLYLKGINETFSVSNSKYITFVNDSDNEVPIEISGSIMGLLDGGTGTKFIIPNDYCFYSLFNGDSSITSVSDDFLPAHTLAKYCYYDMFSGCSNLHYVPELPASILPEGCYMDMFNGSALWEIPVLLHVSEYYENCLKWFLRGVSSSLIIGGHETAYIPFFKSSWPTQDEARQYAMEMFPNGSEPYGLGNVYAYALA